MRLSGREKGTLAVVGKTGHGSDNAGKNSIVGICLRDVILKGIICKGIIENYSKTGRVWRCELGYFNVSGYSPPLVDTRKQVLIKT